MHKVWLIATMGMLLACGSTDRSDERVHDAPAQTESATENEVIEVPLPVDDSIVAVAEGEQDYQDYKTVMRERIAQHKDVQFLDSQIVTTEELERVRSVHPKLHALITRPARLGGAK